MVAVGSTTTPKLQADEKQRAATERSPGGAFGAKAAASRALGLGASGAAAARRHQHPRRGGPRASCAPPPTVTRDPKGEKKVLDTNWRLFCSVGGGLSPAGCQQSHGVFSGLDSREVAAGNQSCRVVTAPDLEGAARGNLWVMPRS